MFKRIVALVGILIIGCSSSIAQERFEASGFGGFSLNDGVSGPATLAIDGNTYNRVDPKDGWLFGGVGEYLVNEQFGVGFIYSHVFSNLILGGTSGSPDRNLGGMGINNYHGTAEYNFGVTGNNLRPFIYAGFGATSFGSVDFNSPRSGTVPGRTKFSTQWGGGVKYFFTQRVAIRGAVAWIPTYIKSNTSGYWCDPVNFGCYAIGDPQYSNQVQFTGGMSFRF